MQIKFEVYWVRASSIDQPFTLLTQTSLLAGA